jgi:hypothetical protein
MYQYIAQKEWVCVGPPTEKKVGKVCIYPMQTSVDLVSATDGLFIPVAEAILGVALAKSQRVHPRIHCLAMESLRPTIRGEVVSHGQMMGCYLSFPLLCLQSYIASRWATRGMKARQLVNGDDTLISSEREIGSYPDGFELNLKKTIRSVNTVELNSTVFLKVGARWREVRHLRKGGFRPGQFSGMLHAAAVCKEAGPKWVSAFIRSRLGRKWDFLPSQLGLPLSNHDAWRVETAALRGGRVRSALPTLPLGATRFEVVEEVTELEQIGFRIDLFEGGREGNERKVWDPSYWANFK